MINSYAYRADSNSFSFSRRGACWHEARSTRLPVTRKFQQLRRKLNNSEPTTQLQWNHRDDFNIINGTGFVSAGTNFSARRLPLSKLTRFFLRPLLNRILEVRPRYISRWHRKLDRPHSTLHFVELFAFLLSSLLFFSFFFLSLALLTDRYVLRENVVTTAYFDRHQLRQSRTPRVKLKGFEGGRCNAWEFHLEIP